MNTTLQFPRKYLVIFVSLVLLISIVLPFAVPATAAAQTTPPAAGAVQQSQPTVCSGGWFSTSTINPVCWFRTIVAGVSSILISISILILEISGVLFNLLVDHTIINFGQFLYGDAIKNAVETAWGAFRDISNIVIIGMFVFVAVSIILGNETFGQRKMVAKIIVIAILINFSLLFTKVIIDFSNFAALQFYNAAALQTTAPTAAVGGAASSNVSQKGISGAFLNYMGVTGIGDSYTAVRKSAESSDYALVALAHGLMASIFLLAAAIVLLYGSFLLASRGILLIFLLLTSSIAFATYLIPIKVVNTNFGWGAWWNSLLKSAVFAPLLMIFLWITLAVAKALKDQVGTLGSQNGTLGDLMSNPTKGANLEAFFGYIIVLGLLFISFKVASSFSTSIAGFNYAAVLPAGIAGASARALGLAGRLGVGLPAMAVGNKLQAESRDTNRSDMSRALFDFGAQRFNAAGKKDFNAMRTSFGSAIEKTAGMKAGQLAGDKVGGMAGMLSSVQKDIAARATRMTPSKDELEKQSRESAARGLFAAAKEEKAMGAEAARKDREKVREEAVKAALDAQPADKAAHDKTKEGVRISKEDLKNLEQKMSSENADARAQLNQSIKGMREQQVKLRSHASDKASQDRADEIEKEISKSNLEALRALTQRNEKIKVATEQSQKLEQRAASELSRIEERAMAAMRDRALTAGELGAKRNVAERKLTETTAAIATRLADKSLTGMLLKSLGMPGKLSGGAVKTLKEQAKRERAKLVAEERKKLDDHNKPSAPAPSTESGKH